MLSEPTTPDGAGPAVGDDDDAVAMSASIETLLKRVQEKVWRGRSRGGYGRLSTERQIELLYRIGHESLRPGTEDSPQGSLTDDQRPIARLLRDAVSSMCSDMLATKVRDRDGDGSGHGDLDGDGGGDRSDVTGSPEYALRHADAILQSSEYAKLKTEMLGRLGAGVESIVANLDHGNNGSSFVGHRQMQQTQRAEDMHTPYSGISGMMSGRRSMDPFDLDLDASYSGLGGFLPAGKELEDIFESLAEHQTTATRLSGLHKVGKYDTHDLMGSPFWDELQQQLCLMLMDEDIELADETLDFMYRMFHNRNGVTREVYIMFVEHVCNYIAKIGGLPSHGLGPITRQLQVLNEFQHELPKYWIRYGERNMAAIVNPSMELLNLGPPVSATHLVALYQPDAQWFTAWIKGRFCRQKILEYFRDNRAVFRDLVASMLVGLRTFCTPGAPDPPQWVALGRIRGIADLGARQVAYLHLIHVVSIVATILRYQQAQDWLFPLDISNTLLGGGPLLFKDHPEIQAGVAVCTMSPRGLVANLVHAMCTFNASSPHENVGVDRRFDLVTIIANAIKVFPENTANKLLFDPAIITQLLLPLQPALGLRPEPSPALLLIVADLLARIANVPAGRKILLGRTDGPSVGAAAAAAAVAGGTGGCPADTITLFTLKCIEKVGTQALPSDVERATNFLLICRLLYRTHDGFGVIAKHKIDVHLKQALMVPASGALDSMTPWDHALIDSLLNLASTPKGMQALQGAGTPLVQQCAALLFQRFQQKLQVSKYEKFGYGVLVMQFATTEVGMLALYETGQTAYFVKNLLEALGNFSDVRPKDEAVPDGPSLDKATTYCMKVFSCFEGLRVHLVAEDKAAAGDAEHGFDALVSQLLLLDAINTKGEQFHLVGLKIMSVLVSCLDSLCLIESRSGLSAGMLKLQEACRLDEDGGAGKQKGAPGYMVDPLSLARNRLLVAMEVVGGPNERLLPPIGLDSNHLPFDFTLFASKPAPAEYWLGKKTDASQSTKFDALAAEITAATTDESFADFAGLTEKAITVLHECREAGFARRAEIGAAFGAIIKASLRVGTAGSAKALPRLELQTTAPAALEGPAMVGLGIVTRYLRSLELLRDGGEAEAATVLGLTTAALSKQRYDSASFLGFDWFTVSAYSMFESQAATLEFLDAFAVSPNCSFLWHSRLAGSTCLPQVGTHPLYHTMVHLIEETARSELPAVTSAFRLSGYTISQIAMTWLRQCFWNYLDWEEIVQYIALCIAYGPASMVYYSVSVLKHLQPKIIELTQKEALVSSIKTMAIEGFRCHEQLGYLAELRARYSLDATDFSRDLGL